MARSSAAEMPAVRSDGVRWGSYGALTSSSARRSRPSPETEQPVTAKDTPRATAKIKQTNTVTSQAVRTAYQSTAATLRGSGTLSFYGSMLKSAFSPKVEETMPREVLSLISAMEEACGSLWNEIAGDKEVLRRGVIWGSVTLEAVCDALDGALFFGLRPPATPLAISRLRIDTKDASVRQQERWCEYETPHFRAALVGLASRSGKTGALRQCLEDCDGLAFVRTAHGSCRAWHRAALRKGMLLEALQELFTSPKLNIAWYRKSVVTSLAARRALLEKLEPVAWLARRLETQFLPLCDDRLLDWPFLAYDARRVLRLVRPSIAAVHCNVLWVEVTHAGTSQLLGIYKPVAKVLRENDPVYETEAGYEIVRLICRSRVAW